MINKLPEELQLEVFKKNEYSHFFKNASSFQIL